ncbi:MAG TPA: proline dehydrogenase family protein [Thermomicrobiales bacterium]|jgi:proline dehydrogenase|nr:proline dehydrogenase family protein [Thermomicrobiales bacterium]
MDLQQLFRRPILAVADNSVVERTIRRSGGGLVRRFVAGETLDESMVQVRRLAEVDLTATLDQLGENVRTAAEATAAVASYTEILDRLAAEGLEPNISVKLTMLGLDFGDDAAYRNLLPVVERAAAVGGFVRVDMEGSTYTERTIAITERAHAEYPGVVGTVIQAYLHRSEADVARLMRQDIRIRLVKGAYAEPASIAFQGKEAVDGAYRKLLEQMLGTARYPAIATHDPALIALTRERAERLALPTDAYEFQLLYGVRRDEQLALRKDGYRVRVYVPYGTEWYPYFTRRIAERPANALFVVRSLVKG